ncbi:MBL fold metallo-hydrolase [Mesorhizobium comanense]|uniref:MBL fold metallo-hydrolase n=1 Tax=Mesorhizobium comanense TaxID=2502215 RepID=UPI0010F662DA|nr:MBL fold metallo-hydrolase [Mesorhizobium comanense]
MAAPFRKSQNAGWFRFYLGDFECTVVWDGYIHHGYEGIFPNADPQEMGRLQHDWHLPSDHIPMDLNPVVVNTGEKLILVDTGMGRTSTMFGNTMGRMLENMRASGIEPEEIDVVLMTHLHPDHSFGLINPDGSATFANADLYVTRTDWNEWANEANLTRNDFKAPWSEGTLAAVAPYRQRLHFVTPGKEVLPGIVAFSVAGHSSGQCAYIFESRGEKVVFTGDVAHHQIYDPAHPEWFFHMDYDSDPEMGAAAKSAIFAKAVDEGIRFHGYHFPYPGLGDMVRRPDGTYRFHPQTMNPRLYPSGQEG